jgi:cytochrome P450
MTEQADAGPEQHDLSPVPDHVPEQLVVDFDFYNPPGADQDFHAAWSALQQSHPSPLIWTPRNGGHWIALRGPDIHQILADYDNFASGIVVLPASRGAEQRVLPTRLNPPEHGPYRALLNPGVSAKSVMKTEPFIRQLAIDSIERFKNKGSCEFISEYSAILPIGIFMTLVDLPTADIPKMKQLADQVTRPDGSLSMAEIMQAFVDYLDPYVSKRREQPGSDMLSDIVNGEIDGQLISYDDAMDLSIQFLIAGMDTVASFLGFMLVFLANNPDQRQRLVDDPSLIPAAADEFLRRYGLVSIARTVTRDQTFHGVQLKQGDYVLVPTLLHGIDPDEYADPLTVDFQREVQRHSTFGNGPHRCPGQFLARTEVRVTLEEWLRRIPHFAVDPQQPVRMQGGIVGSIGALPLVWDVADSDAA